MVEMAGLVFDIFHVFSLFFYGTTLRIKSNFDDNDKDSSATIDFEDFLSGSSSAEIVQLCLEQVEGSNQSDRGEQLKNDRVDCLSGTENRDTIIEPAETSSPTEIEDLEMKLNRKSEIDECVSKNKSENLQVQRPTVMTREQERPLDEKDLSANLLEIKRVVKINSIRNYVRSSQAKKPQQNIVINRDSEEGRIESTTFDSDEDTFWNSIKSYLVPYRSYGAVELLMKSLIIELVVPQSPKKVYELLLFCALYLRDPENSMFSVIGNEGPYLLDEYDFPEVLMVPEIDYTPEMLFNGPLYSPSASPEERDFTREVLNMDCQLLALWCPAFACLIVQLANENKKSETLIKQLGLLNDVVVEVYNVHKDALPTLPQNESFIEKLRKLSRFYMDTNTQRTLFKGFIRKSEDITCSQTTKRLLNFLILQSLEYNGMELLTLVDRTIRLYGIEFTLLIEETSLLELQNSWENYLKYKDDLFSRGFFWKYCKAFDSTLYPELSFEKNAKLCLILSILVDWYEMEHGAGTTPNSRSPSHHFRFKECYKQSLSRCEKKFLVKLAHNLFSLSLEN